MPPCGCRTNDLENATALVDCAYSVLAYAANPMPRVEVPDHILYGATYALEAGVPGSDMGPLYMEVLSVWASRNLPDAFCEIFEGWGGLRYRYKELPSKRRALGDATAAATTEAVAAAAASGHVDPLVAAIASTQASSSSAAAAAFSPRSYGPVLFLGSVLALLAMPALVIRARRGRMQRQGSMA